MKSIKYVCALIILCFIISMTGKMPVAAEEIKQEETASEETAQDNSAKGWTEIDHKYYFFDSNHKMVKNKIAGTKKDGYYYVGKDGVRVNTKEMKLAVKFVLAHSNSKYSNRKRLKQCYNYLWKHYRYRGFQEKPTAGKMPSYAYYMLKNKRGDCLRYASSFAYIARALGYDSRVYVGKVISVRGTMVPHAWTEVKVGGKWYMCDANMQMHHPNKNAYMRTKSNYPYRHSRKVKYKMTTSKGQVKWSK